MTNEEKLGQFFSSDYCDGVPCTKHDHSGMYERMKNYADKISMTQPTIKEKIEKLLTDEIFNSEPCNIRLFATNIARLICEEMTGKTKYRDTQTKTGWNDGWNARIEKEKQKAKEILKALE